ncbi:YopX family protein [Staphylococcus hominis]|uniref:YopX family protein n=1 Tax=Staphylococcus hominis TaxID=1290 RepID=UPI0032046E9A
MKNFKFRAWDKDHKYMEYTDKNLVVCFSDEGSDAVDHTTFSLSCTSMKNFELMQSTGLKDKNGAEIYEGDIVQHSEKPNPCFSYPFEVIQARTGEWRLDNFRCGTVLAFSNQDELEVLGNIYENPELLEDN